MMKKILFQKHIISVMMLAILSLIFVCCSNDSDEPQINPTPNVSCSLVVNSNTFELTQQLEATVSLDASQSSKDVEIKQVEFYIDNVFIQKIASSPFVLNYKIENISIGAHILSAKIIAGGNNYNTITLTKEVTISVTEPKEPEIKLYGVFPDAGANGQIYHGWVYLDCNGNSSNYEIKKIEFYWDNIPVETDISGIGVSLHLDNNNAAEGSEHTIKATAIIGYDGYKDKEVTLEQNVKILTSNSATSGINILWGSYIFKNGDSFKVNLWQCYGKDSHPSDLTVNLYWDDNLVCTGDLTVAGNNVISYQIKNASVGTHSIGVESIYKNNGEEIGRQKTTFPNSITVIK
ncbi:MAG: hypothetical protein HDS17_07405 [Bacteroides sp.]|nr:hypothetical protein [Bacteroides sp.]